MGKINAINNEAESLTVDPGVSGDSYVQHSINTTGKFRIGVDDTDDSFRISQGSVLGINDTFVMTDAGERTLPLQPAFSAYVSSTINNVIGGGSYAIIHDTELFDVGGDYNTSTGVFTAPITGKYLFTTVCFVVVNTSGGVQLHHKFYINSSTNHYGIFLPSRGRISTFYGTNSSISLSKTLLINLTAADTVATLIESSGGSNVDDVLGGSIYTNFSGYLAV